MTIDRAAIKENEAKKQNRLTEKMLNSLSLDEELKAMMPDRLLAKVFEQDLPLEPCIDAILTCYADRPALGMRDYHIVRGADGKRAREYLPAFKTTSYDEHQADIRSLASVWTQHSCLAVPAHSFVLSICRIQLRWIARGCCCLRRCCRCQ